MEINKGTDVILVLNEMRDVEGNPLFIKDCDKFKIKVWTSNKDCHLVYYGRDVIVDNIPHVDRHHPHYEHSDGTHPSHHHHHHIQKLRIAARDMNCLASGVIQYSYDYLKPDGTGGHDIKTIVTDLYWRNTNFHEEPCNPINYFSIEELRDKIEAESLQREKDIADIQNYIDNDFSNGLGDEIERSTAKDEEHDEAIAANAAAIEAESSRAMGVENEIFELIGGNAGAATEKAEQIETKLDDEIERSTAKDTELEAAINAEVNRATTAESNLNLAITNEQSRAQAAEQSNADQIDSEKERAKAAEEILRNSLAAANAQILANTNAITAEAQRSSAADTAIETKVDGEIARAKTAEGAIETKVDGEIARAKGVESDLTTQLSTLKTTALATKTAAEANTADIATIKTDVNGVKSSVTTEVARATAAEQAIDTKVNANTVEIATIKTNLSNASNDVTAEVSRATAEESRIEAKADANAQAIAAEVTRAQGIESDITTQLQTLKTSYMTTKGIAESNQTALNTVTGDATVIGSIAHSLADAKHYTDDAIANATSSASTDANAYTDQKIAELINGAPSTLDTLKEIADALGDNSDVVSALTTAIGTKANAADVYTKVQVDAKETAINAAVNAEVTRAQSEEARIENLIGNSNTNLTAEIARATAAEGAIETKADSNTAEITAIKIDVNGVKSSVTTEVARATAEEGRIETKVDSVDGKVDTEIARATAAEQAIDAKVNANTAEIATIKTNLATASNNVTAEVSRATAEEARIEGLVNGAKSDLAALTEQVSNNTDAIADEVSRATAKDGELTTAITTEVNRAKGEEGRIEGVINTAKTELNAAITAVDGKADANASAITTEANRAKAVESDITTQLSTLKTSYLTTKTIAEANQTALATVNGDATVIGSIAHSLEDAKHYTDDAIANANAQASTDANAYTDQKIAELINGAPSTLDTLKEIADALGDNSDVVSALTTAIGTKANASDVYTKNEVYTKAQTDAKIDVKANATDVYTKAQVDAKETAINANVNAEVTRATAAENAISTIANQANDVAAQAQTAANANATAITTANTTIAAHTAALGVINGDDTVIGSIAHAVKDCKHYTDDAIANVQGEIPTKVSELENDLNYVKLSETSVVKDQNDNVINELWIDNSELDDTIEVYTKAQCDARFAQKGAATGNVDLSDYYTKSQVDAKIPDLTNYVEKDGAKVLSDNNYTTAEKNKLAAVPTFWQGTQAQYDAIANKDNNTIYIVL